MDRYTLGIPNNEVRIGLINNLVPTYLGMSSPEFRSAIGDVYSALLKEDVDGAMTHLRSYIASIPYPDGGKEILNDMSKNEYFYEMVFYIILSSMCRYVQTQVKTSRGRADMVMHTPTCTYVFEFKMNGTAQEALKQIDDRGYMIPYESSGKKLTKIGVNFSCKTRTIEDWAVK
jgi:hypothetical protein